MSLSEISSLNDRTVQRASKIFGYLQADSKWSLRIKPDQMDILYFIMNCSQWPILGISSAPSVSSIRSPASMKFPFPKSWSVDKKRPRKAATRLFSQTREIIMADVFSDWKKQVFAKSLLDLPVELLLFIAAMLPQKSLVILCRLNSHLSNVIGYELYRPLDRALKALHWSWNHCQMPTFKKAVEALSNIPEKNVPRCSRWCPTGIFSQKVPMLEYMGSKGGLSRVTHYRILLQALMDDFYRRLGGFSPQPITRFLEMGADPNGMANAYLIGDPRDFPVLWIVICGSKDLEPDFIRLQTPVVRSFSMPQRDGYLARVLLEHGADPNFCTPNNTSVLHVAASTCHQSIVKLLVQWGADVNKAGPQGLTPLHVIARQNYPASSLRYESTIDALLQAPGINPNVRDDNGHTPLAIAAGHGGAISMCIATKVLQHPDIELEAKDNLGQTVLENAIQHGNFDIAKLLINAGAQIDIPLTTGLTARQTLFRAGIDLETLNPQTKGGESNGIGVCVIE